MDKKQAMAILQLSEGATRRDAKTAFRRLAKLHHPDHFAQDACAVLRAEKQMKAVNQAYHLLKSLLPPADKDASPVRGTADKNAAPVQCGPEKMRSPGFADMVNRMKKTFWKKTGPARHACRTGAFEGTADTGRAGPGDTAGSGRTKTGSGTSKCRSPHGTTESSSPHGTPESSSPHGTPGASSRPRVKGCEKINRPCGPGTSFEQVFKPLFSGTGPEGAYKKGSGQGFRQRTGRGHRCGTGTVSGSGAGQKAYTGTGQGPDPRAGQESDTRTGHGPGTANRSAGSGHSPYAGFVRYMELKNRIQARTRLQDRHNSTKVEKISRIRPVGRVVRD